MIYNGGLKINPVMTEFSKEIDAAFQKAWHSNKGGDAAWYEFMQHYGAEL